MAMMKSEHVQLNVQLVTKAGHAESDRLSIDGFSKRFSRTLLHILALSSAKL
jgi:hypothetical protein